MTDDESDDPFDDESDDPFDDDPFDDESVDESDAVDDPFARLDEGRPEAAPSEREANRRGDDADRTLFSEAKTGDRDPVDAGVGDGDTTDETRAAADETRAATDAGRAGVDDPFDEIAPATDEFDVDPDAAFEQMDAGDIADEDIWELLDAGATGEFEPAGAFGGAAATGDAVGGGFGAGAADVEHVVSKRTYCQQCPHFSSPPDVACDHEGTTILEAVGFDDVRVQNCPMVDEGDPTFDTDRDQ